MLSRTDYSSDQIVADRGERIYQDLYQDEYEMKFPGQFVVIEVVTKRAYVSETADGAITKATEHAPNGLFHIIRIQGSHLKGVTAYFKKLIDSVRKLGDIKLS